MQSELSKAARDFMFLFIVDGGDRGISLDGIDTMEFSQKFAALEAALSTDAEPVAWQFRCEIFPEWQTTDQKPGDQLQMEYETGVNMKGLEVRALYTAPPAPSVAVKAIAPVDVYKALAKFVEADTFDRDHVTAISRAVASALSAQVRDVAGWQSMKVAPRDGTEIILRVKDGYVSCSWDNLEQEWNAGWIGVGIRDREAIGWAPLPAAPAAKQEGVDRSKLRPIFDDTEGRN